MLFSVLGAKGLARELGKKGTVSDVSLYNVKKDEGLFSFVEPSLYPEKISSLVTAARMGEAAVVFITPEVMNYQLGEVILVLDYLKKKGFFVLESVVREQVRPLVKGSFLQGYDFVEKDLGLIWDNLASFKQEEKQGPVRVVVDHSFQVKGVGTVILGVVRQGVIRKYDKLFAYPLGREVLVKSIQVHDEDVQEAGVGTRVGLALKGVSVEEVPRGAVLTVQDGVRVVEETRIRFVKNPFFKEDIPKSLMASVGLQNVNCFFEDGLLRFGRPVALYDDFVLLFDQSKKVRIIGGGECEV